MQKLFKRSTRVMLLACLSLTLMTSCGQKSKLKLAIESASKQCPMSVGTAGEITSISFDGTDVLYLMTMNESYINIEALDKTPGAMKSAVSSMLGSPKGAIKEILELIVETNSGMKFTYKGATSGKEASCHLSADELKELINEDLSQEEIDKKKLEQQVNITNVSCPMAVDEATTLDKLAIEGDEVVYYYTIDESSADMASLKENAEEMKESIKSSLNGSTDSALRTFLGACAKCNKGLKYHYKGSTSGLSMEFAFTASEVKAFL